MKGSKQAPDRELLLANHTFPGAYVVKAFGPSDGRFAEDVCASARAIVGTRLQSRERASKGGRRICVTLTLEAKNVDEVIHVYEKLHTLDDLLLIL